MGLFGFGKDKDQEKAKAGDEHDEARRRMEAAVAKRRRAAASAAAASAAAPAVPSPASASPAAPPAQPASTAGGQYTVRSGDSLSKIAKSQLGDASKWRQIYDANREVIGENPDLIKPGQSLRIPGASAGAASTRTA